MFNLKSNEEVYNCVSNHYSLTSRNQSHYGFIIHALEDFDSPFGPRMLDSFDDVNKQSTLDARVRNLRRVGNLLEVDFGSKFLDEFTDLAVEASKRKVDSSQEVGRYLHPNDAFDYLKSIESPTGRAIQCLAYTAGLTPNDLLRELNNLKQLKNGLAVVGERLHACNPKNRTVDFNPDWLNQLDPDGEVVGIIQAMAKKVTPNNAGDLAERLGNYYNGSGYTIFDLRNSHAINLDNEGCLHHQIAEIQGCKTASLRQRLRNFKRKAGL